ncbi:MAG: glycosyltransferase family 2 protein [Caldilineaceae bacterium]|nr:glycosyltransferase family 2 protein [Caldilineaceae bacterium]
MSNLKRSDRLLIIIPAYNEQGAINQVVSGVRQAVPQADVLVINDGSVDNTAQEAESAGALVVEHPFNLGIGGAVQTGLKFARDQGYDYVIRLDGDGQHNANEIELFLNVLRSGQTDMVVGSRFLDADVDWHIPFARRIGINFFSWAVSLLIGDRTTDTTSGFCGMNRRVIDLLATYLPQDYPDVESRVIVHKAGLRQLELPVHMRARMAGVSSISSWKSIYYAFKVSLAMITSALKDINLQSHSPYINGNGSSHRADQNRADQHSADQNGHTTNGVGSNGTNDGASNGASNGAKVNSVVTNGISASPMAHKGLTPNGAEIVQPSGVES